MCLPILLYLYDIPVLNALSNVHFTFIEIRDFTANTCAYKKLKYEEKLSLDRYIRRSGMIANATTLHQRIYLILAWTIRTSTCVSGFGLMVNYCWKWHDHSLVGHYR